MDSKGRIVLPKEVRKDLDITPRSEVEIHEKDGKAIVEPEDDPEQIIERMEELIAGISDNRQPTPYDELDPQSKDHVDTIRRQAQHLNPRLSMSEEPHLFDVGVTALAHSDVPVNDTALSYVRRAISGEIDAIVPYASVVGAHNALTTYYGISNDRASTLIAELHGCETDPLVRGGV